MTSPNGVGDQVEGLVEARNERGIRIGDVWHNQSKFHPIDLPDRGARVRLELDSKGFIKSLQVLANPTGATSASSSDRDRTITRLSVLKTAAAFVGQMAQVHPEIKSDHVIPLAERWLTWVDEGGEQPA